MKTNDIIKILQELDPKNECEVTISNQAIEHIGKEPAYWDGCMKIIEQNKNIVTKLTITSKGMKIVLFPFDIRNTFWENIDFQIEYQGEPWVETTYKKKYEEIREETRKELKEFENDDTDD